MFPKRVKCDECGAPVAVQQAIPVFEMELDRPPHFDAEPTSWCCVVNCRQCGQRTQYVARVAPLGVALSPPIQSAQVVPT
jgi:hypothetical protein